MGGICRNAGRPLSAVASMSHVGGVSSARLVMLEVLDLLLVLLGPFSRCESTEIAAFPSLCIFLAGINAKFTGFEFANHLQSDALRQFSVALQRINKIQVFRRAKQH